MKKLLILFTLISVVACKKNKEQATETKAEEVIEITQEEPKIDYASYGMKDNDTPKGLEKGSKAPEVNLTIDGKQVALVDLYKNQNVAIIFYRGYWCPYCSKHLSEFATRAKELEDKGIKLIAVTPENEENVSKAKDESKANFTIISDLDGSIQKAFDVDFNVTDDYVNRVNEGLKVLIPKNNANGKAILPVPATYVINTNGDIIYAHFDPDYSKRASIDDILNAI